MKRAGQYERPDGFREHEDGLTLSLEEDGIDCVPAAGYNHYLSVSRCQEYHTHPGCVELVVCLRGDCIYSTPEGEFALKSGGVMVSRPDQPHMLDTYHKGLRMYWLHLRLPGPGSTFLGLTGRESDWIADRMMNFPLRIFRGSDRLVKSFSRLFEICAGTPRRTVERTVRLKAAVMEILMAAIDSSSMMPMAAKRKIIEGLADEMRAHPECRYLLADLAERAKMSVSNLIAAFKRQTGLSPHAFLLSRRIDLAKRLLSGGKSVLFAADASGFGSPKRFSTCFRQYEGCSPREWLKLHK